MELSCDGLLAKYVGQVGTYQILLYVFLAIGSVCQNSFNMAVVFLAAVPEHWCASPSLDHLDLDGGVERNLTVPRDEDGAWIECTKFNRSYHNWTIASTDQDMLSSRNDLSIISCDHGWSYSTEYYITSIVTEWDLVCEYRWLQATSAAVFMAGYMLGVIVSGTLSDMFGRRPLILFCSLGLTVCAVITIFSTSYMMFSIARFFTGAFGLSLYTVSLVLTMEIIGPSWRSLAGLGMIMSTVVGYELVAIAYFIREWRKLQAALTLACIPFIFYYWVIIESPRWLYVHSRPKEAEAVIRKIAKVNRKCLPNTLDDVAVVEKKQRGFIWDLFRTPRMRVRMLVCCFLWVVSCIVYYGLSFTSTDLSGDPYLNFFLSGGVEVPAYLITAVIIEWIGRRWSLSLVTLLAGACLLLTMAVPKDQAVCTLILTLIAKAAISATFAITYVVTAEVFPTTLRNQAMGVGSTCARIGGIVAPYIGQLSDFGQFIPVIIFGSLAAAAGLLSFVLPESKGVTLPETLEDGENMGLKKRPIQENEKTVEIPLFQSKHLEEKLNADDHTEL